MQNASNTDAETSSTDGANEVVPSTAQSDKSAMRLISVWSRRLLFGLTIVFYAVVLIAMNQISAVERQTGISLDVLSITLFFGTVALLLLWAIWVLMLSRWRWRSRLGVLAGMLLIPFAFFKLFRPVNSGDATIARYEPIWNMPEEVSTDVSELADRTVDLTTTTPRDFPQFLGPDRDGVIRSDVDADIDRFAQTKIVWKQPIGRGWSGFSAQNGYAVTMEQRGEMECVTCYDLQNGELCWIYEHEARHRDAGNMGRVGPRSTPTIHDGLVYALGAVGNLVCLNGADGEVVWQQDLNQILGIQLQSDAADDGYDIQYEANTMLAWGRAASPLVYDDSVVVPGGGPADDIQTLLCFDRVTGDLKWSAGDEMIAYGSPVLATVAEQRQILMTAESEVMGFDPSDGRVLWRLARPGSSDSFANTSQVTVVSDNHVLTSKGYPDGGGELIRLDRDGDNLQAESIWKSERSLKTKLTSPVVQDDLAWCLSNGFLECADLTNGKRIWRHRGRFGHGQLLMWNQHLLVHSEFGNLYLFRADDSAPETSPSVPTVDGVCWNTLCLYGDRVLVRSELEAACLQIPTR